MMSVSGGLTQAAANQLRNDVLEAVLVVWKADDGPQW